MVDINPFSAEYTVCLAKYTNTPVAWFVLKSWRAANCLNVCKQCDSCQCAISVKKSVKLGLFFSCDIQSAACINSLAKNYSGTESGISLCINDITLRESVSVYFCLKSIMVQREWLLPALLAIVLKVGLSKNKSFYLYTYIRLNYMLHQII